VGAAAAAAEGEEPGGAARRRDDSFREVRAGERLGRYQVGEPIGEGGMAQVFRARDPELRRDVAIKVLFPHLSRRADVVRRFHREARAAARLRHPAILQTYDVGGGEDGEPPYIVMELVRGASLQEHPAAAEPVLSELVACAGAVIAEALAVAHEAGVIHRDLKPANLLVTDDGRLLLADFGVAHVELDESLATRTGTVLGTPAYMSPEQASGEAIDARSDLYSLGATLYHLATGALPYSGPPMKVMSQLATPGSLVAPQARRPSVGRPLSAAIVELMAHKPASRPATARAAAAMLRALAAPLGEAGAAVDPAQELAAYLRAPAAYLARQTPRVVAALVEESQRARAAGKLASAIALADRASVLAPEDEAVQRLVQEVTSRQPGWLSWRTGALALGLVGAVAAAVVWRMGREQEGGGAARVGLGADAGVALALGSAAAGDAGAGASAIEARSGEGSADRGSAATGSSSERVDAAAGRPGGSAGEAWSPRASGSGAGAGAGSGSGSAAKRGGAGVASAAPERSGWAGSASPGRGEGSSKGAGSAGASGSEASPAPAAAGTAGTGATAEPAVVAAPAMASVTFAMDAWCELFIDGKSQGRADRAKAIALSAGSHAAECTQGPGLGRWRGELVLAPGEARQVSGELSLEVKVVIDVTGSAVAVNGKAFANQQRMTLRNGRHHVVVRQGARELASGWVSIPRVAACTLRDRPQLDCYP
jgi:Protein kinase domain